MNQRIKGVVAGTAPGLAGVAGAAAQSRLRISSFPVPPLRAPSPPPVTAAWQHRPRAVAPSGSAMSTAVAMPVTLLASVTPTGAAVSADGGSMTNTTDLGLTANGGTAISDASGGNYNLAFVS